ncbi:hypothetical protein B0H11DRAFT_1312068 [Mycena galericulata]|nr:hypothetical protein B0H11DRAFT_1312068 [Mycena galericulata]
MSQHQSSAPAFKLLPAEGLTVFESTCGHPGCTYMFRHEGRNPLFDLSVLMKAHRPDCVGLAFAASHQCKIRWTLTTQMDQQLRRAKADPEGFYFGPEYCMDQQEKLGSFVGERISLAEQSQIDSRWNDRGHHHDNRIMVDSCSPAGSSRSGSVEGRTTLSSSAATASRAKKMVCSPHDRRALTHTGAALPPH